MVLVTEFCEHSTEGEGRGEKKLPLLDFCDHFQEDMIAATQLLWVFQKLVVSPTKRLICLHEQEGWVRIGYV